jgi:hypothetical protein
MSVTRRTVRESRARLNREALPERSGDKMVELEHEVRGTGDPLTAP